MDMNTNGENEKKSLKDGLDDTGSDDEVDTSTTSSNEEEENGNHHYNMQLHEWTFDEHDHNLFVQRTTNHLLTYRNDPIYDEDEEEDQEDLSSFPFLAATVANDFTTVQTMLKQGAIDKNETADLGRSAMWYAAYQGHLAILQLLVEQGGDMEKADHYGRNPLLMASLKGNLEAVRHLLEQGANRDTTSNSGWTPLHWAAENEHIDVAKLLMVYGADLDARTMNFNQLPIDQVRSIEMLEAIRDEPRRRMDHGYKRTTEQDRHPNVQDEGVEEEEVPNAKGSADEDEGEVADEDQDSDASDSEEE